MSKQATPGPWKIVHIADPYRLERWEIVNTGVLAEVYSPDNARLIAAAPDLLEVLERFMWICDECPPTKLFGEIGALIKPARTVIAKARGEA